jgi:uncharacterized protein
MKATAFEARLRRLARGALIAGILLAAPPGAWAGPEEDYEAGAKAFRAGDMVGAIDGLKKAADAGNVKAQTLLAHIHYLSGENELALTYYRMAADQGDAEGMFGLGSLYMVGEGVQKDPKQAFSWMKKAADKGQKQAINAVAQVYVAGTAANVTDQTGDEEALKWIRAAADQNYEPAMTALVEAYTNGGYGLAPDAAQAQAWKDRIKALTAQPKKDPNKK